MFRLGSNSRFALTLRRLKGRFGISAPKVAVRTHFPWYLRLLITVCAFLLCFILAASAYDAGRRFAGFDRSETGQTIEYLQQSNRSLEEEAARMRSLLMASDSNLQIEQASQRLLNERNSALAEENARLKEDLAVYERLLKPESKRGEGVTLDRFKVEPDGVSGRYRYSFLVALQGARRGKETKLAMQFIVTPRGGSSSNIVLPRQGDPDISSYDIELRNFRRIDGRFQVPPDFYMERVELRISEAGEIKASQSLTF